MSGSRGDTIAALTTAPGSAAVAIVRLSGPEALAIARRVAGIEPRPRQAELCDFKTADGQRIDQGLLLYFPAPHSYTGEDVVELQGHGGPIVADWLLETAFAAGARPAEPGEFTLRAFLNDKLDLAQAEAVADLIASGTRQAASAALRSLTGRFSEAVEAVQAELTALRVQAEAWLDFPDEEIDREAACRLAARADALLERLGGLSAQAAQGRALRDGLSIVIAGPPNAGKSSLLNRLAGYDAAIVTAIPGTTRDALREHVSIEGLPVSIIDTAGLRQSSDPVEIEGIRRAQLELERADRILWVADAREGIGPAISRARAEIKAAFPLTVLLNKTDLLPDVPCAYAHDGVPVLRLSVLTGEGFELLTEHLKSVAGFASEAGGSFSARRRHLAALTRAAGHLCAARAALGEALELGAEELRAAQTALGELTGEITSDDLLGEIFSSFCIGK
ncbi:MAG TPA: tRNA uridine-5-carboxymethylaminomethyl(34) synthesis GTPase MnmE [Gammaproteobacteria bacterium]|nr:tRNA uridine-5-carboxymethylaminomethyl(34) synthesis GTPase MnmE [Gammaproteobacteria bacterium]